MEARLRSVIPTGSAVRVSPDTPSSKANGAAPSSWWLRCASAAGRAPPACSRWLEMGVRELFELKGRVALVTGGSRGLGVQIAQALGGMGAKIAIGARTPAELEEAKSQLAKQGIDALTVVNDLTKPEQVPALVEAVVGHYGGINILVNNAGTSWGAPAEQYPLDAWNKVMTLNSTSVFMLSQAVANRCFIPQHSGNIIVVASVAALRVGITMEAVAYSASTTAAMQLTLALPSDTGP